MVTAFYSVRVTTTPIAFALRKYISTRNRDSQLLSTADVFQFIQHPSTMNSLTTYEEVLMSRPALAEYIKDYTRNMSSAKPIDIDMSAQRYDPREKPLRDLIEKDESLRQYFRGNVPALLECQKYCIVSRIGRGGSGDGLLAMQKADNRLVFVKTCPGQLRDTKQLSLLLKEFMHQDLAHKALDRNCRAPRPLGFIPRRSDPSDPKSVQYMMVSEFCAVIPGDCVPLSVAEALMQHSKRPLLSTKEWREIMRKLIRSTEKLNEETKIYHLDLKPDNIMLQITNNRIEPIMIDFGLSTRYGRREKGPILVSKLNPSKYHPHSAPELFQQSQPSKTCDIYGISFILHQVGTVLHIAELQQYISNFRSLPPEKRPNHRCFASDVEERFEEKIRVETRRHHFERSTVMQHANATSKLYIETATIPQISQQQTQPTTVKKETQFRSLKNHEQGHTIKFRLGNKKRSSNSHGTKQSNTTLPLTTQFTQPQSSAKHAQSYQAKVARPIEYEREEGEISDDSQDDVKAMKNREPIASKAKFHTFPYSSHIPYTSKENPKKRKSSAEENNLPTNKRSKTHRHM